MAKIIENTQHEHVYKRGNMIWVSGTLKGYPHTRISSGKKYSKVNLSWVEKNWEELLQKYHDKQHSLQDYQKKLSITQLVDPTMKFLEDDADSRTIQRYRSYFKNYILPVFGEMKLDDISKPMIRLFQTNLRKDKKLGLKTILNIRSAFSAIYRYAIEADIFKENRILSVQAPREKLFINVKEDGKEYNQKDKEITDSIDPFSLDDVWKIIDHTEIGQFKNILTLLFFSGIRTGEMVALRWDDVDWNSMTINIRRTNKVEDSTLGLPKSGQKRKVDILSPVSKALKAQAILTGLKKSGFIFLTKEGNRYKNYDTFGSKWEVLLKRTGFDQRTFYQTRHSFASIMLQKGEELLWISRVMLGHSEVSTTLKYYAKYIKDDTKRHALFLGDERTDSVQGKNLKLESA